MSYVAGMRFADFIVMSADAQESVNDEVCYEEKIEIERTRTVDLVIGGAGRSELTEGFPRSLVDDVKKKKPSSRDQMYDVLTRAIHSFYANDVRIFPGTTKAISFVIASRHPSGEFNLWKSVGTRVKEMSKFAAVGYARPLVSNLMRRLYRPDLTANQAVLLAFHVIASAKIGSRVIGGDPQVVFVNKTGVHPEPAEHIADMNNRFNQLLPLVEKIVLAMPDLSLMESSFKRSLDEFSEKIMQLRWDYKKELSKELEKANVNWPYEKLPVGFSVITSSDDKGNVRMRVCDDPSDPERETQALRIDEKGILHFKQTSNIYISEKTYEHLLACPSASLKDCIQHIGLDG